MSTDSTTPTSDGTKGNAETNNSLLIETILQQSVAIQRLERIVELNHQVPQTVIIADEFLHFYEQ